MTSQLGDIADRKSPAYYIVMRAQERSESSQPGDFSVSPTWPRLVHEFPIARELHLQDCTHFIPMQMPDRVIDVMREELSLWTAQ